MLEKDLSGNYNLFLNMVSLNKEVWLLMAMEGAFAMFEDGEGQSYIPIWSDEKSALPHIKDEWENYYTERMPLFEFMGWLNELERDHIMIAVSSEEQNKTIPIIPEDLKAHITDLINSSS